MKDDKAATLDTGNATDQLESHSHDGLETVVASKARAVTNLASSLGFIETVKNRSAKDNKPEVYDEFIQLMQEFHLQRINTAGVTEKINQIFNNWPDLKKRFDEEFIQPSKIRQLEKKNEDRNTTGSGSQTQT
ncbi:hypothetical protein Agabi119p4_9727 [Agaricus bisporus var. burnettii]|uniref:Uncharacterized protein n=1 Tax=Agaricus bisporus var. burnettii TaxID=192524 RepID=A0A8H7C469_AGABI|nr:hypothetical protein Agabi119p4_9727 [Agaricus bisporus var. burnettii]